MGPAVLLCREEKKVKKIAVLSHFIGFGKKVFWQEKFRNCKLKDSMWFWVPFFEHPLLYCPHSHFAKLVIFATFVGMPSVVFSTFRCWYSSSCDMHWVFLHDDLNSLIQKLVLLSSRKKRRDKKVCTTILPSTYLLHKPVASLIFPFGSTITVLLLYTALYCYVTVSTGEKLCAV